MTKEALIVNPDSKTTIQRGKHNRENPFVMISKNMLRDPSLSPKSKGVLCYLLSLPDDWKANPSHLSKVLGISRNTVYSILKELINLGYAKRTESKAENGQFQSVTYEFFEEKIEVTPEFKEKSTVYQKTVYGKSGYGKLNTTNTYHKDKDSTDKEYHPLLSPSDSANAEAAEAAEERDKPPKKKNIKPAEFSPAVQKVAEQMIAAMEQVKPNCAKPNLVSFMKSIDLMMRRDNREEQQILDVFCWAMTDPFWASNMFTVNPAEYLRKKFDSLEMKMTVKPVRKFLPSSDDKLADEYYAVMKATAI